MTKTALVAIGGNSLNQRKNRPDVPHQWDAVRETSRRLADMIDAGWNLNLLHTAMAPGRLHHAAQRTGRAQHTSRHHRCRYTGSIGYMLQQALRNELRSRGNELPVASIAHRF